MSKFFAALASVLIASPAAASSFEGRLLTIHNRERADYGAAPLVWNDRLAADAAVWAKQLAVRGMWKHDPDNRARGENLWMGTAGAYSLEEMARSWADEERHFFRPGVFPDVSTSGSWHDVGHYTQIVWPGTREVGCAVTRGGGNDYLACRYWPAGNVVGVAMR